MYKRKCPECYMVFKVRHDTETHCYACANAPSTAVRIGLQLPTPHCWKSPATGDGTAPRKTVSRINFGTPTVVSSFGV